MLATSGVRSWLLPLVLAASAWILMVISGVTVPSASLLLLVTVIQVATGAVWWAWLRGSSRDSSSTTSVELLGMGIALGTLGAVLGSQLTIALGLGGWGWAIPTVGAAVVAALGLLGRVRLCRIAPTRRWLWIAVSVPSVIGLVALAPSVWRTPLGNGYVVGDAYHGDLVFLEAVSHSVATIGPTDSLLLAGEAIKYHWFAYAWAGSMTEIAGADAFVVLTRLLPLLTLVGTACLAASWAARLTRVLWVPTLAALLVVVAAYVGAAQGVVLTYDSPSAGYAAVLLLAYSLVLTEFLSGRLGWWALLPAAVLAGGTVGAKVSHAGMIVAGVAALVLVSPWAPSATRRRAWALAGSSAFAMVATYALVLAGIAVAANNVQVGGDEPWASTLQGLDPFPGRLGITLGTGALILAIVPRWAGFAWLPGRDWLRRPEVGYGCGIALAGLGAVAFLSSATNAGWFALAAATVMGVLSAVGVGVALAKVEWVRPRISGLPLLRDPVLWAAIVAILVTGAALLAYALAEVTGASVLWRGPVLAWVLAAVAALLLARSRALKGRYLVRWLAMLTTVLVLSSVAARFGGSVAWDLVGTRLTPAVQRLVLLVDPAAQFSATAEPAPRTMVSAGAVRAAALAVAAEDERGAADGVARTGPIIQWSPALQDAAEWLAASAESDDVVAVDQPDRQPFLPIMTGLRTYLAGLPYTVGYTTESGVEQVPIREDRVKAFLRDPSDVTVIRDLRADGVRWIWVQWAPQLSSEDLAPLAEVAYENAEVRIVELSDPGASSG